MTVDVAVAFRRSTFTPPANVEVAVVEVAIMRETDGEDVGAIAPELVEDRSMLMSMASVFNVPFPLEVRTTPFVVRFESVAMF